MKRSSTQILSGTILLDFCQIVMLYYLGKQLLAFWDGVSTESDSLISIQHGSFRDQSLHSSHASVQLIHGDLSDLLVSILLPEGLNLLLHDWDLLSQGRLEVGGIASL